jgi:hypothetical protein
MKIRQGFVSNSSSSSFICTNCNTVYEIQTDDFCGNGEVIYCENDHIIEEGYHGVKFDRYNDDGLIEECCSICSFDVGNKSELKQYFLKTTKYTEEDVLNHILNNQSKNSDRKKLLGTEYVDYVLVKKRKTESEVLKELRDKFTTYRNFLEFIRD